jgi:hypothetical protein
MTVRIRRDGRVILHGYLTMDLRVHKGYGGWVLCRSNVGTPPIGEWRQRWDHLRDLRKSLEAWPTP